MAIKSGKVISILQQLAPSQLQADWDNSGLQVGNRQWPVEKVLLALDVTLDVMQYAVENGFDFVLAHHPLLFRKLARIDTNAPGGKIISLALTNNITVFSMHTNLDVVKGGVSDALAELLNLEKVEVLDKQKGDYYKLAVFVPQSHYNQVRKALGDAGAGWIGNYSHCTFSSPGIGTFLPQAGASPWLGEVGRLEEVEEYKLETLVPGHRLADVLAAMRAAHPYEEIAYDLLPLAVDADYGLGRIGFLPEPIELKEFAAAVARVLDCPTVRVSGTGERSIHKVALCGGSGGNYVSLAHGRDADVLLTGDISHHQALDAFQLGLALVDPGHYSSEYPILYKVETYLRSVLPQEIVVARYPGSTDPLRTEAIL